MWPFNTKKQISKYRFFILCITYMAILTTVPFVSAGDQPFVLSNTQRIKMTSELTGYDHELIVFLPNSYENSPEKSYPVLYFADAYWDMPLLYSIHGQLTYDNVIPELIMVGFSYAGDDVNYGSLRSRDLSPTTLNEVNSASGQAPQFLAFIEQTVIPYIESEFRADPQQRALSGSSLGGLFTLYAMYEKPELFKRYIAISPAAGWDKGYLLERDNVYASLHQALPVRLFLSYGSAEYKPFRDPIIDLQKKLAQRDYRNFALLNYIIKGERHSGVKSEGYSRGLRWVFEDIAPTGPGGLQRELLQNLE